MTKLTFKVQLLKPVLWLLFLFFFSGGNRLQIFRAHHPQHDCVDEGRFVVPQYFHCYHAGIRFRCILHLQYGFRYLYIVVILYMCGVRICVCDRVRKWIRKCRCAKLLSFRTPANVHCGKMCAIFVQDRKNVCDVRMQPKSSLTRVCRYD